MRVYKTNLNKKIKYLNKSIKSLNTKFNNLRISVNEILKYLHDEDYELRRFKIKGFRK